MGPLSATKSPMIKKCVITTSRYLSQYYKENMLCDNQNTYHFPCLKIDDIYNITSAYDYEILIDFQNKNMYDLLERLLNDLISLDSSIYIKVIYSDILDSHDIRKSLALLQKLKQHDFIKLSVITDKNLFFSKTEIQNLSAPSMDNVIFFVGPGNTGKTSTISSLGFVFEEKGHKVALLDLTEHHGLINYFSSSILLRDEDIKKYSTFPPTEEDHNNPADIALYVYTYNYACQSSTIIYLYEFINTLSKSYDWVLINTDVNIVSSLPQIFNLGDKIFVVQDFMPTKIDITKSLLTYLENSGIHTTEKVSLIYNKKIKGTVSLQNIEEKMLFRELPEDRLALLVDLSCNTFEINYDKRTMTAMIDHLVTGNYSLNGMSTTYRQNIHRIYEFICNDLYTENTEIYLQTYVTDYMNHLFNFLRKHTNLKSFSPFKLYRKNRDTSQ